MKPSPSSNKRGSRFTAASSFVANDNYFAAGADPVGAPLGVVDVPELGL